MWFENANIPSITEKEKGGTVRGRSQTLESYLQFLKQLDNFLIFFVSVTTLLFNTIHVESGNY